MTALLSLALFACSGAAAENTTASGLADVTAVAVSGDPGAYTFDVTVQSPDVDCSKYADWWEVLTSDGTLVYRRILNHSHPTEQPFTRDGGPVAAAADQPLIVRAHLNPGGYGGAALKGTAAGGFTATELAADFAASLATADPLPESCWF
jgi:hypothetical protein